MSTKSFNEVIDLPFITEVNSSNSIFKSSSKSYIRIFIPLTSIDLARSFSVKVSIILWFRIFIFLWPSSRCWERKLIKSKIETNRSLQAILIAAHSSSFCCTWAFRAPYISWYLLIIRYQIVSITSSSTLVIAYRV